jgi:cell division protein FtsI/penicillin-binding protein 2
LRSGAARGSGGEWIRLASLLGTDRSELEAWMHSLREPDFWRKGRADNPYELTEEQAAAVMAVHLNGVYAVPCRIRYPEGRQGIHAIGYISQHPALVKKLYARELASGNVKPTEAIGGSGLERSLDRLMRGAGPTVLSHFTDGTGGSIPGLDLRIRQPDNPYYPLQIGTTLDLTLQRKLEAYTDSQGLRRGAVVVLDAANADIVAMLSRPALNPLHPGASETDTANHALRAVTPGSVFKLVTEAAALEADKARENEQFHCSGEYGKYGLSCWLPGGHGMLTLREALAQSCNVAFATVAERLTPAQLQLTADRLGIGRQVGWQAPQDAAAPGASLRLLPEEEAGRVFASPLKASDAGLLAQTGIGQRDAAVTPLQAANLAVTLLHGGRVQAPRLVREIRYASGKRMAELPAQDAPSPYGRISPATAEALLRGMEAVVARGTGQSLRGSAWTLAGKSGTAQAGPAAAPTNHQWFVGYGPVESPRYAVAVLAEDRPPGSANQAAAVFRGVMNLIAAYDKGLSHNQIRSASG